MFAWKKIFRDFIFTEEKLLLLRPIFPPPCSSQTIEPILCKENHFTLYKKALSKANIDITESNLKLKCQKDLSTNKYPLCYNSTMLLQCHPRTSGDSYIDWSRQHAHSDLILQLLRAPRSKLLIALTSQSIYSYMRITYHIGHCFLCISFNKNFQHRNNYRKFYYVMYTRGQFCIVQIIL